MTSLPLKLIYAALGDTHASELPLVFGNFFVGAQDGRMSALFQHYWSALATCQDPNCQNGSGDQARALLRPPLCVFAWPVVCARPAS